MLDITQTEPWHGFKYWFHHSSLGATLRFNSITWKKGIRKTDFKISIQKQIIKNKCNIPTKVQGRRTSLLEIENLP